MRKFDLTVSLYGASLSEIQMVKKSVLEQTQIDTDVSFSIDEQFPTVEVGELIIPPTSIGVNTND